MGTVSLLGVKRPGCTVDQRHLTLMVKKGWSYTSTRNLGLRGLLQDELLDLRTGFISPMHVPSMCIFLYCSITIIRYGR
jgi:hypothetical protein